VKVQKQKKNENWRQTVLNISLNFSVKMHKFVAEWKQRQN